MPRSHVNPQAFSARLCGKELHDHDLVESPAASNITQQKQTQQRSLTETTKKKCSITRNSAVYLTTLLIGHATGKQIQTRTRTNGATVAPIAKP